MNHFVVYINLSVLFVFFLIIVSTFFRKKEAILLRVFFTLPFFIVMITCISNLVFLHFKYYELLFLEAPAFLLSLLYGPSLVGYTFTLTNQKIPKSIYYVFIFYIPVLGVLVYDLSLDSLEQIKKMREIISGENIIYNIFNIISLLVAIYFCVIAKIKINKLSKEKHNFYDYFKTNNIKWASKYINYMIGSIILAILIFLINGLFGFIPMIQIDLIVMPLFMLSIYSFIVIKSNLRQYEVDWECQRLQVETNFKLQEQKLTISRDLHDNIGSQLTFLISSVDNVKYSFDINNSKLDEKLTEISSFAKETIVELRDTLWAMNSNEISFEDLESRILNFIGKAREVKDEIEFSCEIDANLKSVKFSSIEGMNIYRTVQETLNNAIKHANSTKISIVAEKLISQIQIIIQDDGIGFDPVTILKGNGLRNMKKRIEDIGGKFDIESSKSGTKIIITLTY